MSCYDRIHRACCKAKTNDSNKKTEKIFPPGRRRQIQPHKGDKLNTKNQKRQARLVLWPWLAVRQGNLESKFMSFAEQQKAGNLTSARGFKGSSQLWWGRPEVKFSEQEQEVVAPCMSPEGI